MTELSNISNSEVVQFIGAQVVKKALDDPGGVSKLFRQTPKGNRSHPVVLGVRCACGNKPRPDREEGGLLRVAGWTSGRDSEEESSKVNGKVFQSNRAQEAGSTHRRMGCSRV